MSKTRPAIIIPDLPNDTSAKHKNYSLMTVTKTIRTQKLLPPDTWETIKPPKAHPRTKTWTSKYIGHGKCKMALMRAESNTIAHEFFRLFLPRQPKTRTWVQAKTAIYQLYEKIKGVETFEECIKRVGDAIFQEMLFAARADLAEISVLDFFLKDTNHALSKFGFDNDGRIIKLCVQSNITFKNTGEHHCSTPQEFQAWTYISHQDLMNALTLDDYIINPIWGVPHGFISKENAHKIYADPLYKQAANRILSHIIYLKVETLQDFIVSYVEEVNNAIFYIKKLRERHIHFRRETLCIEEFRHYICDNNQKANQDFQWFIHLLFNFKAHSNQFLIQNQETIRLLLEKKQAFLKNDSLQYEIIVLLQNNKPEIAKKLLQQYPHEIDLNNETLSGTRETILHIAIRPENIDMELIQLLCEKYNVKLNLENINHLTPLSLAALNSAIPVVQYFLSLPSLCSQLSPRQMGLALEFLLANKEWSMAALLLQVRPDADVDSNINASRIKQTTTKTTITLATHLINSTTTVNQLKWVMQSLNPLKVAKRPHTFFIYEQQHSEWEQILPVAHAKFNSFKKESLVNSESENFLERHSFELSHSITLDDPDETEGKQSPRKTLTH